MKKRILTVAFALFATAAAFAQKTTTEDVTSKNSWLKVGLEASVPVGDISDASSFAGGLVVSGQWMVNPHFGLGLASGYTNFFGKDGVDDFGLVPANLLLRYYPKSAGFFGGVDAGYTFLTNVDGKSGGFSVKPQVGYHNYSWNFYAFYNHVLLNDNYADIQNVGVGASYNLRFGKK